MSSERTYGTPVPWLTLVDQPGIVVSVFVSIAARPVVATPLTLVNSPETISLPSAVTTMS